MQVKIKTTVLAAAMLLIAPTSLLAQNPIETVMNGCATEIETYCSQVSPGEGRLLACFYAHEDKLSGKCQFALYTADLELEAAMAALEYVANECRDDILAHCGEVQVGEGRVIECLKSNSGDVSESCMTAVNQVTE